MPNHLSPAEQRRLDEIEAALLALDSQIAELNDKARPYRKERRYILSKVRVRQVRARDN